MRVLGKRPMVNRKVSESAEFWGTPAFAGNGSDRTP